jgi:hypothetical protein
MAQDALARARRQLPDIQLGAAGIEAGNSRRGERERVLRVRRERRAIRNWGTLRRLARGPVRASRAVPGPRSAGTVGGPWLTVCRPLVRLGDRVSPWSLASVVPRHLVRCRCGR